MPLSERQLRALARTASDALVDAVGEGHGRALIAAVSGGADSSAMLWLLRDTQQRHGWRVRAAHVDHGIQTAEVRRSFRCAVQRLCAQLGVPLDILEADAPADADRSGDGLEAAARRVRYQALSELALERGAPIVAAAHTRDDQAETVLLHILRGSGLDGLSGMAIRRSLADGVDLVRPMLQLSRADSEAVCRAIGVEPVHDPANDSSVHTRNRIRQSLLPLLREFNPNAASRLAQLAQLASDERALLDQITQDALESARNADALDRRALLSLPDALRARVVRLFCREQSIELTSERTAAALAVITSGHGVVELPGGRLSVADGTVTLDTAAPQHEQRG